MEGKVLIVSPDEHLRETLQDLIEMENYQVSSAGSGKEAIEFLSSGIYPIVLVDPELEDKKNIEIIKDIRAISPESKIIAMISKLYFDLAIRLFREPVEDILIHPIDFDSLRLVLKKAEEKYLFDKETQHLLKNLSNSNKVLNEDLSRIKKEIAMISNDLSNAIMTIKTNCEILTARTKSDIENRKTEQISKAIEIVESALKNLEQLYKV